MFPHDDLYPTLHDKVVQELSYSETGHIPIHECSDKVEDWSSKGRSFNRIVLQSGRPLKMMCNVTLPHGQCLPVTDLVRIQELAKELQPQL